MDKISDSDDDEDEDQTGGAGQSLADFLNADEEVKRPVKKEAAKP